MTRRGVFVSFEGGEGAGKSTVLAALGRRLSDAGIPFLATREPGGTPLAEGVRALVLDPSHAPLTPATEALLMFAARADHVVRVIEPALARGTWVLADRYVDASYAYQGGGRGVAPADLDWLTRFATGGLLPDRTWLLDVPIARGSARVDSRGTPRDRMEREDPRFHEAVRAAYRARAAAAPARFSVIDATQPLDQVIAAIVADFDRLFAAHR